MKGLRAIWLLAWTDVLLTTKSRSSFVWMLLLPVAMMWLFGEAMSGSGGPPKISLTVDDRDGGWLARALVAELDDEQIALNEGEEPVPRLRTLVLPEGMTQALAAGSDGKLQDDGAQTLRLEIDPEANREMGMGAEIHVRRALLRVLGRLFRLESRGVEASEAEAAYAALAAEAPAVALAVRTAGQGEPVPAGYAQSVPGILTMIVLMMTLIYGGVFLVLEKKQGMLRRQLTLPFSRRRILAGKLLGRLLIAGLQIALLLAVGRWLFGLSLGHSPLALGLLMGCYAVAVAGLSLWLGAAAATTEQASTVGWIASMVMAGLGGCWWPGEVMPEWLRQASHLFPTAWAMDGLHAVISFGRGAGDVVLPALVLLAFGMLATLLGARSLRAS